MPRGRKKKELPPLENGLQETHIVQKSKPLFSLWKSDLTLSEFKILDTYLSRIDSHKSEQRSVTLEKGKLEEILGVKKINRKDLDVRLEHLQKTLVNVGDKKRIDRITLFERAQGEQDDNGIWKVTLTCTPSAMKYIFNIDKLGYLRYQIRCITQISSLYSYILFTYLEYNRFRKSWEVSLEELKTILNCDSEAYNEFKEFNRCILKRCQNELQQKTELRYTYEPLKNGRKVFAIKFTLETLTDIEQQEQQELPDQLTLLDTEKESQYSSKLVGFLAEACDYEFSDPEMIVLKDLIIQLIPNDKSTERYDYLIHKYHILNAQKQPIKNRYAYLKSIIQKDTKKF